MKGCSILLPLCPVIPDHSLFKGVRPWSDPENRKKKKKKRLLNFKRLNLEGSWVKGKINTKSQTRVSCLQDKMKKESREESLGIGETCPLALLGGTIREIPVRNQSTGDLCSEWFIQETSKNPRGTQQGSRRMK